MLHLTSGFGLVVEFGLAVFCFVDVLLADEAAVRWLPRWAWALAILVFPIAACIGWLVAGRTWRHHVRSTGPTALAAEASPALPRAASPGNRPAVHPALLPPTASATAVPSRRRRGTDRPDEPSLLDALWDVNEEHERTLMQWEQDLRRRERALRERLQAPTSPTTPVQDADAAA